MAEYDTRLLFVGGVHGVGKSSLCETVAGRLGMLHLSAGSLLGHRGPEKSIRNAEENQNLLVRLVGEHRSVTSATILDGHFCILNDREPVAVSAEIFRGLSPARLVVLKARPETILLRLAERDGVDWSLSEVAAFQGAELRTAAAISQALNLSLVTIDAENRAFAAKALGDALER